MSSVKRILITTLSLIGAPFLCLTIGYYVGGTHKDPSNTAAAFALMVGISASLIGFFLGLIIGLTTLKTENRYYAFCGFVIPPSLGVLYILFLGLFGS
ncbi:MAG: hypothetical protein V4702_00010 [Patescibacteria group bacterium]